MTTDVIPEAFYEEKITTNEENGRVIWKMTSHGTPVKYPHCDNAGENQLKL